MVGRFVHDDDSEIDSRTENIPYPSQICCLRVAINPYHGHLDNILLILRSSQCLSISIIFIIFFLIRLIFAKPSKRNQSLVNWLIVVFTDTLGIFLSQNKIKKARTAYYHLEHLWNVGILLFSIVATVTLAGIIYKSFVINKSISEINTLEELAETDVLIYLLTFFKGNWTSYIR